MPTNETVVIATSGYFAEVLAVAESAGVQISALMGEGHPLDLADQLGVAVLARAIDIALLPAACSVVVTVNPPSRRAELAQLAVARGHELPVLVHADTTVGPAVSLGAGTIVSPGARLAAMIAVGDGCLINTGAVLSHDDVIGDYVTISPNATLTGGVVVGDRASIGAAATILPGVKIGAEARVGAGAVVTRDVAAGTVVAGVPARELS